MSFMGLGDNPGGEEGEGERQIILEEKNRHGLTVVISLLFELSLEERVVNWRGKDSKIKTE